MKRPWPPERVLFTSSPIHLPQPGGHRLRLELSGGNAVTHDVTCDNFLRRPARQSV